MKRNITQELPAPSAELIDAKYVAALISVEPRTVYRLRLRKELPPSVKFGGNVRWIRSEIMAWIAQGCPPTS